jgi:hypothetical protein
MGRREVPSIESEDSSDDYQPRLEVKIQNIHELVAKMDETKIPWRSSWSMFVHEDGLCVYKMGSNDNFRDVYMSFKIVIDQELRVSIYKENVRASIHELDWVLQDSKLEYLSQFWKLLDYYFIEPDIMEENSSNQAPSHAFESPQSEATSSCPVEVKKVQNPAIHQTRPKKPTMAHTTSDSGTSNKKVKSGPNRKCSAKCPKCLKKINGGIGVAAHLSKCNAASKPLRKRKIFKSVCWECNKKFKTKSSCAEHLAAVHNFHIKDPENFCFKCKKVPIEGIRTHSQLHNCKFKCSMVRNSRKIHRAPDLSSFSSSSVTNPSEPKKLSKSTCRACTRRKIVSSAISALPLLLVKVISKHIRCRCMAWETSSYFATIATKVSWKEGNWQSTSSLTRNFDSFPAAAARKPINAKMILMSITSATTFPISLSNLTFPDA